MSPQNANAAGQNPVPAAPATIAVAIPATITAPPISAATSSVVAAPDPQQGQQQSSASDSNSSSVSTTRFTIPITAPVGNVRVTEPSVALGPAAIAPLFKIWPTGNPNNASANWIVFGWNITDVVDHPGVTPTSLTVRVGCANGFGYPVGGSIGDDAPAGTGTDQGQNAEGLVPATRTAATWDPVDYASSHPEIPVPQGMCTLSIADPARSGVWSAANRPGYLSPNTVALSFGVYTGEAYTPLISGGYACAGCTPNSIVTAYQANPIPMSLLVTFVVCFLSGAGILFRGYSKSTSKENMGGKGVREGSVGSIAEKEVVLGELVLGSDEEGLDGEALMTAALAVVLDEAGED
ncbi:hypothetical protein DFP72DRAFT_1169066 [Ephemerocybe angulata]|uniref:DUF7137 domain-containing protein n=1 Tax=Ephemerocybe angulata TaxID=980116 RepID=A0A8H6I0I9_9AGAR|nr:hypothetical protein DFP72DRAFT_1169066 [Tulosesus angulatus]